MFITPGKDALRFFLITSTAAFKIKKITLNHNGISTSRWLRKQFGDDLDHLKRMGTSLETDGETEPLVFVDSSLCQKIHCKSQGEVKKVNDKGIVTD